MFQHLGRSWDIVTFLSGLCTTATGSGSVPQRRILAAQGWLSGILLLFCASLPDLAPCPHSHAQCYTTFSSRWLNGGLRHLSDSLCFAIARGTGTVIGNALGAMRPARARRAGVVGLALAMFIMCIVCGGMFVTRNVWSDLIPSPSADANADELSADSPSIGTIIAQLMPYAALFM